MFENATLNKVFESYSFNILDTLYSNAPSFTFQDKIKKLRLINGLTQSEFAHSIDKGLTTICNWEQGNRTPTNETLNMIIAKFNLPLNYFK